MFVRGGHSIGGNPVGGGSDPPSCRRLELGVLVRDVHLIEAFADLLGTGIVSGDYPMPSTDGRESAPRP